EHDPGQRDDRDLVPGRLAAAVWHRAVFRGRGAYLARAVAARENLLRDVLHPVDARDFSALPLRPADAAWLEGISAVFAVLACADRGCADRLRLGSGALKGRGAAAMVRSRIER